jgi:serine phosphatase RsbU (regulator of sigma subunit)
MKGRVWWAGLGRAFVISRRVALGVAAFLALRAWIILDQATWLPGSIQNMLAALIFFSIFPLAWVLGAFGGILGWRLGRRQDRPEFGATAGVFGFLASLILVVRLLVWLNRPGRGPGIWGVLLLLVPLFGPWVVVRWLGQPLLWTWSALQAKLLELGDLLGQRLVIERPFRFDARGLALGLLGGLIATGAALAGLFRVTEAAALAQRIQLRNEPIRTAVGPIELSRLLGEGLHPRSVAGSPRGIVVLHIDEWTEAKLLRESSQAAVHARLLRKLASWQSGPVILSISPTALTTAAAPATSPHGGQGVRQAPGARPKSASGQSPRKPARRGPPGRRRPLGRPGQALGVNRSPGAGETGARQRARMGAEIFTPASAPLDAAALAREQNDLPELVRAVRATRQTILCALPAQRLPSAVEQQLARYLWSGVREVVPVPNVTALPEIEKLAAAGKSIGSAEFAPFSFRQVQTLRILDRHSRWALPLLLASGGDRSRVSPRPSPGLTGTLQVGGRALPLAAPGRLLINPYGSQPGAVFPTVSYSDLLNDVPIYDRGSGRRIPPARFFRGQIVFLDALYQPSYDTPVGSFRATELLAMATDNVLRQNVLAPPTARTELLLLLIWGALAGHLAIGRSPLAAALRVTMLACFYWLMAAVLFVPGLWLPVVSVTTAMVLAYLLTLQFVMTSDARALDRQRGENARFEQEVIISRAIQTSLLPPGHLRAGEFEIVSRSDPAREVGGDFYNTFPLTAAAAGPPEVEASLSPLGADTGRIGVVLGDVSGKGVQGAMYMTVATTLLEARADADSAPEAVLAVANVHLHPKIHRLRMFVTAFYGVLEVATGRLEYASAGQVRPVLLRAGTKPSYLTAQGMPLGSLRHARYERQSVLLAPGDTLVLASDGFTEARDARGRALGYDGFLEIVARAAGGSPSDCLVRVFEEVSRFSGPAGAQVGSTKLLILRGGAGVPPGAGARPHRK